jgi:putative NADPH-quinone reductase
MKPLVILGSARSDGETRRVINIAFAPETIDLAILPNVVIGGYDYDHRNANDGFGAIAEAMRDAASIVFATPVYWYAMSAPLKIFFDRLTDLTENLKPHGKALAGKSVWVIATGSEPVLPEGFEVPFARTAEYFDMRYRAIFYLHTGEEAAMRDADEAALERFGAKVVAG